MSETRARRVEKIVNCTDARRMSETRSKPVRSTLGTLGIRPVRVAVGRLKSPLSAYAMNLHL